MRGGHRSTAQARKGRIARTSGGPDVYARCRNIWLQQIGRVKGTRPAAAKTRHRIVDVERPDRERRIIDRSGSADRRAIWTAISSRKCDKDPRRLRVVDYCFEFRSRGAAFAGRAAPGIVQNMRAKRRVRVVAREIGRRDHELETLRISSWRSVADVHIAAADPLCTRSYSDLISGAIIANDRPDCVSSVAIIIARSGRIRTANSAAGIDRVKPIVIMVRRRSVPAAILRLENVMCPSNAGVEPADDDSLPCESHRPYLWSIYVCNAPFNNVGSIRPGGGGRVLRDPFVFDPFRGPV